MESSYLGDSKPIIRSVSKVQIITKSDYTELFNILKSNLYLLSEEYNYLIVSNFILFYSINKDNSILQKSILVSNENKSL
jgi:hypothetical protein